MSAFVPGFEYDVFVSYSHVDNLVLSGAPESGWIHTFIDNLKCLLAQKLGKTGRGSIWIDRRLSGHQPFPDAIGQAASHSATLLVFLSDGYLQSDWCPKERKIFLEAAQRPGGPEGRIFLVRLTDLHHRLWPPEFGHQLGYQFFSKDYEEATPRTLGMPFADPRNPVDRPYFDRLDDLSRELGWQLKRMAEQLLPETSLRAIPAVISQSRSLNEQPTIFLAETTADLEELRDNFQRHMSQLGLHTLPETCYERAPQSFRDALERDLAQSLLFVQLLGPYASHKSRDLPGGYEGLQLDSALALDKPIMRWHDPELEIEKVRDRELLERAEVMVMPFEDFKREVIDRATRLSVQRERQTIKGHGFVLLVASVEDQGEAVRIADLLRQQHVGFDITTEQDSLPDLAEDEDYDGLMVVYGRCSQSWVQAQIRQCRKIMLRRKDRAPVGAVYRSSKEPLLTRPPRFFFPCRPDAASFRAFISAVQTREPA